LYHTPYGDRILLDAERSLFTHSLGMLVDMLAEGDLDFGVASFQQLQRNQKLVTLYRSARALLHPDEPVLELTAVVESAVATVYEFVKDLIDEEIDGRDVPGESFWRSLVLEAAREQTAIDELPEEYRTAVVLSDLEGLAYAEIAELMGVPVGTVKSRLFRGRQKLQKVLYDYAVEMGYISRRTGTEA